MLTLYLVIILKYISTHISFICGREKTSMMNIYHTCRCTKAEEYAEEKLHKNIHIEDPTYYINLFNKCVKRALLEAFDPPNYRRYKDLTIKCRGQNPVQFFVLNILPRLAFFKYNDDDLSRKSGEVLFNLINVLRNKLESILTVTLKQASKLPQTLGFRSELALHFHTYELALSSIVNEYCLQEGRPEIYPITDEENQATHELFGGLTVKHFSSFEIATGYANWAYDDIGIALMSQGLQSKMNTCNSNFWLLCYLTFYATDNPALYRMYKSMLRRQVELEIKPDEVVYLDSATLSLTELMTLVISHELCFYTRRTTDDIFNTSTLSAVVQPQLKAKRDLNRFFRHSVFDTYEVQLDETSTRGAFCTQHIISGAELLSNAHTGHQNSRKTNKGLFTSPDYCDNQDIIIYARYKKEIDGPLGPPPFADKHCAGSHVIYTVSLRENSTKAISDTTYAGLLDFVYEHFGWKYSDLRRNLDPATHITKADPILDKVVPLSNLTQKHVTLIKCRIREVASLGSFNTISKVKAKQLYKASNNKGKASKEDSTKLKYSKLKKLCSNDYERSMLQFQCMTQEVLLNLGRHLVVTPDHLRYRGLESLLGKEFVAQISNQKQLTIGWGSSHSTKKNTPLLKVEMEPEKMK